MKETELADILVQLCNSVLFGMEQPGALTLSANEWDMLLRFASKQGMLPVVFSLIANQKIEDAETRKVIVKWYASAVEGESRYHKRIKTMRELAKLLKKENIDIMFMKGASLAQLYPAPSLRIFSDIDYYLFGKSEQGIEAMARQGIVNSAYYHHHTQASLNGILLENHYDFVERVNHGCDIILDDALKDIAEKEGRKIRAAFLGDDISNAYLMTPTMNAIFLMRHMSAHFVGETIPLRMLYDWALFLKTYAKEVEWNLVARLYDESGMTAFAGIVQRLLQDHLCMKVEGVPVWPSDKKDVERVWNSIVFPPEQDPHRKFSFKYYLFETKTFFANRWKHRIVYPGESYFLLFLKYCWLGTKKMLGLLK